MTKSSVLLPSMTMSHISTNHHLNISSTIQSINPHDYANQSPSIANSRWVKVVHAAHIVEKKPQCTSCMRSRIYFPHTVCCFWGIEPAESCAGIIFNCPLNNVVVLRIWNIMFNNWLWEVIVHSGYLLHNGSWNFL